MFTLFVHWNPQGSVWMFSLPSLGAAAPESSCFPSSCKGGCFSFKLWNCGSHCLFLAHEGGRAVSPKTFSVFYFSCSFLSAAAAVFQWVDSLVSLVFGCEEPDVTSCNDTEERSHHSCVVMMMRVTVALWWSQPECVCLSVCELQVLCGHNAVGKSQWPSRLRTSTPWRWIHRGHRIHYDVTGTELSLWHGSRGNEGP